MTKQSGLLLFDIRMRTSSNAFFHPSKHRRIRDGLWMNPSPQLHKDQMPHNLLFSLSIDCFIFSQTHIKMGATWIMVIVVKAIGNSLN